MSEVTNPTPAWRSTTGYVADRMSGDELTNRIREHIHFLLCSYPGINRTMMAVGTINQSYGKRWKEILVGMVKTGEVIVRAHYSTNTATGRNQRFVHLFSSRDTRTDISGYANDPEVTAEMQILDELKAQ
jgi:hypothetical protein